MSQMPAQVYGDPGGTIDTWLVGYSGLSDGTNEAIQLIRIDNPLSATSTFTQFLPFIGDVDDTAGGIIPDAPQSGGVTAIDSGDRRVIDAVWRNDSLYFTTEVLGTGDDAGEATAFRGKSIRHQPHQHLNRKVPLAEIRILGLIPILLMHLLQLMLVVEHLRYLIMIVMRMILL